MPFSRKPKLEPNQYEVRRVATRKAAIRRRRQQRWINLMAYSLAGLAVLGIVLGMILLFGVLGAIIIFLGWNVGIVGISHALHGHIAHISVFTAFGISLAISVISRILHPGGITLTKS